MRRILLLFIFSLSVSHSFAQTNVTYFVPLPGQDIYTSLKVYTDARSTSISSSINSVISIVVVEDGAVIRYDHWEDGYEANINSPIQSTTRVWGDNNPANGIPPGFATDVLKCGSVITLENLVPIPRVASTILFDGKDKIASNRSLSITRSAWAPTPGTVLAGAVEMLDKSSQGTDFKVPVGQNTPGSVSMFERTELYVMAYDNATTVQVDADANGSFELTQTLAMGENYRVPGGVLQGARVLSNKNVQVHIITGDVGSSYESRWFTLFPTANWGNAYYSPVSTTNVNAKAVVFLYNPGASAISVTATTQSGNTVISVPANGTARYVMPQNSGALFASTGAPFFAVTTIDSDNSDSGNQTHDWGMTLLPESYLSQSVTVGWGPGSSDLSANGSPIWVMARIATTIYVDLDGDPLTGPLTDPNGQKYNYTVSLTPYQSHRIYDTDKNQTGMRVYTLDGAKIAAAWGQDPSTAGPGNPFLDMGTTIPPALVLNAFKTGLITTDSDADKKVDPNDVITYRIIVSNRASYNAINVTVADTLPSQLQYVSGSMVRKSSVPANNGPVANSGSTAFPLDEGGKLFGDFQSNQIDTLEFRVTALGTIVGLTDVKNTARIITSDGRSYFPLATLPVDNSFTGCVVDFTNSAYTTTAPSYQVNSPVYIKLTATYLNTSSTTIQTVQVTLKNNTNGDSELMTLTETGNNTGIFTASRPTSNSAGDATNDGTLKALIGHSITATHTNSFYGDECSKTATITPLTFTKPLYLSTDGTGSPDQDLDRIHPGLVTPVDNTTATSQQIGFVGTVGQSNGVAIWHENGTSTPQYKVYNGTANTFGSELTTPTVNSNRAGTLMSAQSPTDQNEAFMLEVTLDRAIYLHRWNGSSWVAGTFNPVGGGLTKDDTYFGAQIAYSPNGNAMLVWDDGVNDNIIHYRTWNGTSKVWSAEQTAAITITPNNKAVLNMRLAAKPTSGATEMVLAFTDDGDNRDYAMVWNGTSWGNQIELTTLASQDKRDVWVAYEAVTGRAMVAYAKNNDPGSVFYRIWSGSAWGAEASLGFPAGVAGKVIFSKLASDRASNRIALASTTSNGDVWFALWDGTTWGAPVVGVLAKVNRINPVLADVAFESTSGDLLAVFWSSDFSTVQYRTLSGGVLSNVLVGPIFSNIPTELELFRDPSSDKIMLFGNDQGQDAITALWSGTAWGTPVTHETATGLNGNVTGEPMTFFWQPSGSVTLVPTTTFTQIPTMCAPLSLPAGGSVGATLYLSNVNGTMTASPEISAALKYGTTTFAKLVSPTYDSGTGILTFTGTLSGAVTIPATVAVVLEVTTAQTGVNFTIDYDSSTKPSKIDLPATTVIEVNSLAVYNAPHPGGSIVTGNLSGQTVYVRSVVSDPFGSYDITSQNLAITNPSNATTTVNTTQVATAGCTKTFEYAYTLPSAIGNYKLEATAKEGYEDNVTDKASTVFQVQQEDLGTPCVSNFTNSAFTNVTSYVANSTIYVQVSDPDQDLTAGVNTITVVLTTTTGDSETLTLSETGGSTGVFRGSIPSNTLATTTGNGILNAPNGTQLTLNYTDPDDGTDVCSVQAVISTPTPAITLTKTLVTPSNGITTVGKVVRYRLVVSNTGTTNITQLTLTDTFDPAFLQYDSASVTPNTSAAGSRTWTSNILPIAAGTSKTINVYFKALAATSSTNNTAATTNGLDQNGTAIPNKSASAPVTITRPELTIVKTRTSAASVSVGAAITYTITLTNTGTSTITNLPMADTYSDFCQTFVSASIPPNSTGGGTLDWTNLASTPLAPGGVITITLNFTARNQCMPATNTAKVEFATDANNNPIPPVQSSATVTITETPRIGAAKNLTSIVNNLNGTYTVTLLLTVENFGNVPLTNLTLFDDIPTQFAGATPITAYTATSGTLVANTGWNGTASSNILASGQSLAVGATGNVSISFIITPPGLTTYNNNATVSGTSPIDAVVSDVSTNGLDPDGTNNDNNPNESEPTPVAVPGADLFITKTDGSATYTPGGAITYTIVVGNNGPSNVTGATIADAIPAAITGVSWSSTTQGTATVSSGSTGSGNSLSATVNLPAGAGNTVTFTVTGTVSPAATGNLVNTATVTAPAGTTDPTPGNNSATDTDTQSSQTDLAITKTVNNPTPNVGSNVTFTLTVTNNGPSGATGVQVSDLLPSGYTYVSDNGSGAYTSGTGVWTIGNLALNGTASLQITATVKPSGSYANTATVNGNQTDPTSGNNSATATPAPVPVADLAITKTDGATTAIPGNPITYSLVVTNNGPSGVTGATVTDNLPATLTNVSWTSAPTGTASVTSGGTGSGNSLSAVVNLASGAGNSVTFTVTGTISPTASGTLSNTATVAAPNGTNDPTPANNSATDNNTLIPTADLIITKTDNSATYTPGTQVTYTIVVTNGGPSSVTGATVTDNLPATLTGVTWTSALAGTASVPSGGTGSGNSLSAIVNLPAGAGNSVTFTVSGSVPSSATGNLANTASVAAPVDVTDSNTANNSATDTDTPAPSADLAITKTDNSATYTPGTTVVYTVVVSNAGPSTATGATVADNAPAGTSISGWSAVVAGGATASASGSGNINQTVTVPVGGTITYTVNLAVPAGFSGSLANTATVTAPAGTTDPTPGNNSATDTDTQNSQTDLAITKTVNTPAPNVGSDVTFTLTATNNGPSDATGVLVNDLLPSGYTYVSDNGSGAYTSGTGVWTIGNLALNGTASLQITATVKPTGNYANTATVSGNQTDPTSGNNSATATPVPVPVADLAITKTDNSATYTPGTTVVYQLGISNAGPSAAIDATITDNAPAGTSISSWSATFTGGATGTSSGTGNISQTATVPSGGTITYTVNLAVPSGFTGNLNNTATVTAPAGTTDPTPGNNSATDSDTQSSIADLAVTKTVSNAMPNVGSNVTFTLSVTNNGPSNATGVSLTDPLPSGYQYVSDTGGGAYVSSTGIWTIGNLAKDASVSIQVTALVNDSGNYTNTAAVTGDQPDPSAGNNSSSITTVPVPQTDLAITKAVDNTNPIVGSTVTFTLTVTNNGISNATGVSVADQLPSGYTYDSDNGSGAYNSTTGVWTIGNLAKNTSASLDIVATVKESGNYINTATVSGNQQDPNPGNNTASSTPMPIAQADLAIVKTVSNTTPDVGSNVVFTLTVSNQGPSMATDVVVTDVLPSGFTYVSDDGSGNYTSATGEWIVGSLNNSQSASLLITATVSPTGTYTNTASVTANEPDPNTANNGSAVTPVPQPVSDLAITKTDGNSTYTPGNPVTYTLTLTNAGPNHVTEAIVSDILPGDLINVSWTSSVTGTAQVTSGAIGTGNSLSALVDINAGVGNAVVFTVSGTVKPSATGNLTNTASITAPIGIKDPSTANNSATDTDTPVVESDLSITKTNTATTYTPGTSTTYEVLVGNAGPSDAVGALVTDTAPAGTTITGWTAVLSGGATGTTLGSGNLNETVSVPSGGSILYTITLSVPSAFSGNLVNTATVTSPAGTNDPNTANNTATDTDTPAPIANLSSTKTDSKEIYTPGTTTTYTVVVSNAGPSDATLVEILDNIPAGTTWSYTSTGTAGTSGNSASGNGNINDLATLPAGGSITYSVVVTIPADFVGDLVNTAEVNPPNDITDPDLANNSASDTDTRQSVADLALTNTDGTATYTPGSTTTYTVVVSNVGPSDVTGASVTNNAPAGTTITGWTASFNGGATGSTSGSGNISELVSIPLNGTITYLLTVAIPSNYTGNLVNTASVSPPVGVTDPTMANNSASDTDTPNRRADLSISKTDGATTYAPGTSTIYTIVVSNAGPSDVFNAAVIDNVPAGTSWSYTSTGTAGTNGNTASGTSNIGDLVTIPAGGQITYTSTLTIPSGFSGNLVNTATVSVPAGTTDPNGGNNSATDTDTQSSRADLAITLSDGTATYTPGTTTTYTMVVKNLGPSNAVGAAITNNAPPNTTITGWTAVFGGTAAGTSAGSGAINQIVSIPAGDSIRYTVTVSIPSDYTGNLVSTGTVATPVGITDPTPANNSATDTDTQNSVADLSSIKSNASSSYTPGTTTTYTLLIDNAGPSDVTGATVSDVIPAGTTWSYTSTGTAGTGGHTLTGSGNINDLVTIPAGGKITYTVTLTIPATYTGNLSNTATVTAPGGTTDPNLANNSSTDTDVQNSTADLAITKTVSLPHPEPGVDATFTLVATNLGPSAATGVKVEDLLPSGYTYVSDNVSGAYNSSTGEWSIGNLALNSTVNLQIVATLNTTGSYDNTATISGNENDPIAANNQATVQIERQLLLPKVYLQGALFGITYSDVPSNTQIDSLMRDNLRVANLIPTLSPYRSWNPTRQDSVAAAGVFDVTGQNAIVDWIFVELRSATDSTVLVSSRPALLQRDGDIVNLDGTSPLDYRVVAGATYFVAVRHRNHLGVMTARPEALTSTGRVVDFRKPSTLTYRKSTTAIHKAQVDVLQGQALWAGNALHDSRVVYQSIGNDINVVLMQVVNALGNASQVPYYILNGYYNGDIDLNGKVIFQSSTNDVEYIYQNVVKNHPGNALKDNFFVIQEQLPN